ncbi:hypothetical protein DFH07DRAFT_867534 [Mycena maculata]|uniref:Protein kinase domain-containing protein n=1 Tax=Mycena maculata TaxID=230809 RepID=A0AAD7JDG9_9AGAR|nr:hypothetical protein DFH07DRAFT_867534 [Mycena maculata]
MFSEGDAISLRTHQGHFATYTIIKPFLPFTKLESVVLLAESNEPGGNETVKIYDSRYLDERLSEIPLDNEPTSILARPWTLVAERAAVFSRALATKPFDESQLHEDEPEDEEGRAARAALWEEYFFSLSTGCFQVECQAYKRLSHLQGSAIPRLFTSGHFVLPQGERAIEPPVIVLDLRHIPEDALAECAEACKLLVQAIDSFDTRGVFHGDINHNNVLFSPPESPVRAVLIDFGCGGIRLFNEDEETWMFNVSFANDSRRIRRLLKEKGIEIRVHTGQGR